MARAPAERDLVPLREVADLLARAADEDLPMVPTDNYRWFEWDDPNPGGAFDVEVGGYMLSLVKDWDYLRGVERAVAPDGRESEWPTPCDFSHLMTQERWDKLMEKLRRIGKSSSAASLTQGER